MAVTQNMEVKHCVLPLGLEDVEVVVVGLLRVNLLKSSLILQISVSDLQISKVQGEESPVLLEK